MKRSPTILLALLATVVALFAAASPASAEPALPDGFQDELVLDGLHQPTTFRFAPDGDVFVAEKTGEITLFDSGLGDTTPETFADLRTFVYDRGDRGLLGLALDPNFPADPYVYALYTYDHILGDPNDPPKWGAAGTSGDPCPDTNGGDACLVSGRLVRLTADGDKAKGPAGNPEQKVLAEGWCQQFSSHSVGDLEFGPEGNLYASGGDGASFFGFDYGQLGSPVANPCGDPPGPAGTALSPPSAQGGSLRSQNPKLLNGKILRLDPDTGEGLPDNPLGSAPNANERRTIATGFRNPFRFAFDQQTGDIYTGNVGSSEIEEIDTFPGIPTSVYNSGWPCYEGPKQQFLYKDKNLNVCNALYAANPPLTTDPFFHYSHGQSVVPDDECPIEYGSALGGVSLYEGDKMPGYQGALFFADSVRGCVWVMRAGDDGRPDPSTTERFLRDARIYPAIDIQEGPGGYLYYVNLLGDESGADGGIHKLVYKPGAPKARLTADKTFGTTFPFIANLDASSSTDPGGDPLTYDWDLDEDGVFEIEGSTDPTKQVVYTQVEQEEREDDHLALNRVVTVRVTDDENLTSVAAITLFPGDNPPEVTINSPLTSQTWAVGSEIQLYGTAFRIKGDKTSEMTEPLPYYWSTRVLHCPDPAEPDHCHGHPLQTFPGTRSGDFEAPEHDYPSKIEITLRVASNRGLVGSKTIFLNPQTVAINLVSSPAGVPLTAGLLQGPAPFALTAIRGSNVSLSAPESAVIGGETYSFQSWSDGGPRQHGFSANLSGTYEARYSKGGGATTSPLPPPGPDTKAPATKLGAHPPKSTRKTTAKFSFSSNESGSSFKCKLDRKPFKPCRSPQKLKKLKPGKHTFKVLATDAAGNTDPSAASFSWKVLPKPR